jgi:hypothetical protein
MKYTFIAKREREREREGEREREREGNCFFTSFLI